MELYALNFAREESKFEGFALNPKTPSILGKESLLEDITPGIRRAGVPQVVAPRLRQFWRPPAVTGRVSPKHDSPGINLTFPAFSGRACTELAEFLEPNGELLPLETNVGEFYFYNVTTILDAIDLERSTCTFLASDRARVIDIESYVFREDVIENHHVFRTVDISSIVIVSRQFMDKAKAAKLRGFSFTKMWPHPVGTKWRLTADILT